MAVSWPSGSGNSATAVERKPRRDRVARSGNGTAPDHDRANRMGAPCRQGCGGPARSDAAGLRRSVARLGRHGALRHTYVQSDHRWRQDPAPPGGHSQRPLRVHRQGFGRSADRRSARLCRRTENGESPTSAIPETVFSTSISPNRDWSYPGNSLPERTRQPCLRRLWRHRHRCRLDDAGIRLVHRIRLLHPGASAARRACRASYNPG